MCQPKRTWQCSFCNRKNDETHTFKTWWFVNSEYYGNLYFCCLICFWKWAERELFNKDSDDIVRNEIKERLIERCMMGMLINMNQEDYRIEDTDWTKSEVKP